jgi:asparagine synthase (glutamine-hydrolysing)
LYGGESTSPELGLHGIQTAERYNDGIGWNIALGFRRLSILDLSPAAHQPMRSHDGKVWMIFNGEVYNYVELRQELKQLGHVFYSTGDTEVVLAAFSQWGKACFKRFIGMWACAILDTATQKLYLSRDPFGIKPLYFTVQKDKLAFASEIKALLCLDWVARGTNAQQLHDYFRLGFMSHTSETMFADVQQLRGGKLLEVPLRLNDSDVTRALRIERYWELKPQKRTDLSFDQAALHLRELFLNNVRLHLRSDVPIGTALSGGIDSSAIVMGMRHIEPALDLRTFSFVPSDAPEINEERWADMVIDAAKARADKTTPNAHTLIADIKHMVYAQDVPVGGTSIYAQFCVFRLAHQHHMKVMLDGQGADEQLAGYRGYRAIRLASLLRQRQMGAALQFFKATQAYVGDLRWSGLLLRAAAEFLPRKTYAAMFKIVGKDQSDHYLNTRWFDDRGVTPLLLNETPAGETDLLRHTLADAVSHSNLPALLHYEDRNSMAFSIESRVPFLTTELVEFVLSLPEAYLISPQGTTKAVFRKAMRGLVPDPILDRTDKIGFATPEKHWLSAIGPWVDDLLASDVAHRIYALDIEKVKTNWQAIKSGHAKFDSRVWRWINVIAWAEAFGVEF